MDRKLDRSRGSTSTVSLPLRSTISSTAVRPRASLRAVMITRAPIPASSTAASLPIPAFPPVMTTVLPCMRSLSMRTLDTVEVSTVRIGTSGGRVGGERRYQPIEDYGIIGDLHTVALVGKDGSIDFLSYPHFDSPTLFAKLLDKERGGRFLHRTRASRAGPPKQLYLPDTNVLLTRIARSDGVAEVSDFMPVGIEEGRHPHAIVRRAKRVRGEVDVRRRRAIRASTTARVGHKVEVATAARCCSSAEDGTDVRAALRRPRSTCDGRRAVGRVHACARARPRRFVLEQAVPGMPERRRRRPTSSPSRSRRR